MAFNTNATNAGIDTICIARRRRDGGSRESHASRSVQVSGGRSSSQACDPCNAAQSHISLPVIGFVCTSAKRHSYSIWGRSSAQRMGVCRSASWFSRLLGLTYHEPETGTIEQIRRRWGYGVMRTVISIY